MEEESMKRFGFIIIALMVLVCGFAMADRGIDPVPESQGITTATTLDLVGNMASSTDIQWRITNDFLGLDGIPPFGTVIELTPAYYASSYTEDSYSNGVGLIAYDKNLDVETSDQLSGQWNIDADKQLEFIGVDGARVYSDENIMVDGVGEFSIIDKLDMLCPFAYDVDNWVFPAFCNYAEAGSTVDMTVANVRTNSMDRFINPTSDTSVELEHDIQVTELIDGLPSSGTASAYMEVLIQESRGVELTFEEQIEPLSERIEFSEFSSVHGDITVFDKQMNYDSKLTGLGGYFIVV
jgi:hypothetical protein